MISNMRLGALFLMAVTAFAQHGSGFRGGFAGGARPGFRTGGPGFQRGAVVPFLGPIPSWVGNASPLNHRFIRRGFGGDFFGPYFPLVGDYGGSYQVGPCATNIEPATAAPAEPSHPVVHEYPENSQAPSVGEQTTFTIALADGSRLSAETVWIQDGMLHCVDSQGKQEVLSSDRIDRDSTERLNREKNLHVTLPQI